MESTTQARVFDEDANRCLLLCTDESEDQTRRITQAQAARAEGNRLDTTFVVARHHALQRLLSRCDVRVPFALQLAAALPTGRPDARRAMPQVLRLIEAVALLHQRQRAKGKVENGTELTATLADYTIARSLLIAPMSRGIGGRASDAVRGFGDRLRARFGSGTFSSTEAARQEQVVTSKGKINEYLISLANAGHAECVEPGRGNAPSTWRMFTSVPEPAGCWLPQPDQIEGAP